MCFQRVTLNQHEYGECHNRKDKRIVALLERESLVWSLQTVEDRLTVYEARTLIIKMEKLQKSMMAKQHYLLKNKEKIVFRTGKKVN